MTIILYFFLLFNLGALLYYADHDGRLSVGNALGALLMLIALEM